MNYKLLITIRRHGFSRLAGSGKRAHRAGRIAESFVFDRRCGCSRSPVRAERTRAFTPKVRRRALNSTDLSRPKNCAARSTEISGAMCEFYRSKKCRTIFTRDFPPKAKLTFTESSMRPLFRLSGCVTRITNRARSKFRRMSEAARFFLGEHDWTAFSSANSDSENKVRTISRIFRRINLGFALEFFDDRISNYGKRFFALYGALDCRNASRSRARRKRF